jgi:flagellum-specific peptidoglycan hydrolase FlgJ
MTKHHHSHRSNVSHHAVRHHALSPANAKFIQDASGAAQTSELLTGVPASITIAQAILESAWGRRHIGSANNYFGIKAQNRQSGVDFGDVATGYVARSTKEHLKKENKDITITDFFRSYADMQDSFRDHGLFLRNNVRYRDALADYAKTGDANAFAEGLQHAGYATDPNYAHLLISIMQQHNLYQYNAPVANAGIVP